MKRNILILLITFIITIPSYNQVFETDTLIFNGDLDKRINFVFLGDGYLETELDTYIADVNGIVDELFNQSPWNSYEKYFNVIVIKVPSNVSGAAMDPDNLIDNYFGSTFNSSGIERLLVPKRSNRINSVLASNFPEYDQLFMVVNSSKYGGSGGRLATASTHPSSVEIMIHELGHSFSGLSDEYWAGSQYARENVNMTQETNHELVRWKHWLYDFGIGVYSHGSSAPSWYRPHQNCKMRYLRVPFCAVCREQIIRQIISLGDQIDNYTPDKNSIELTENQLFKLNILEPEPNTVKSSWYFEGQLISENVDSLYLDIDTLISGSYSVRATVIDTVEYIRINDHFTQGLSLINWNLKIISTGIDIQSEAQKINYLVYPNPTGDFLTCEIRSDKEEEVNLSIIDLRGRVIYQNIIFVTPGNKSEHKIFIQETGLIPGLYMLRFRSGLSELTRKLIVN